jgi:hypothetical protein
MSYTNRLAAVGEKKDTGDLDSSEQEEKDVVRNWSGRMKNEGFETVRFRPAGGLSRFVPILSTLLRSSKGKKI